MHPHLLPWWKVTLSFLFPTSQSSSIDSLWYDYGNLGSQLTSPHVFLNPSSQNLRLEADHVTQDRRGSDGVEQKWVYRMTGRLSHLPLVRFLWFRRPDSHTFVATLYWRLRLAKGQMIGFSTVTFFFYYLQLTFNQHFPIIPSLAKQFYPFLSSFTAWWASLAL